MMFDLKITTSLEDYPSSVMFMEERVCSISAGLSSPLIWFLEYPPLFTEGLSSSQFRAEKKLFPVWETKRGGKTTYHGPGQRVIYFMMSLENMGKDIRLFVFFLEEWIIETLSALGVQGKRAEGRTGVWVETPWGDKKIAALGVHLHKWVTSHGISLNIHPDLDHYKNIIPCGITDYGVTSLKEMGISTTLESVDRLLLKALPIVFQRIMKGSIDGYCKT